MIGTLAAMPSTNVSVLIWNAGSLMAATALANEDLIGPDMTVELGGLGYRWDIEKNDIRTRRIIDEVLLAKEMPKFNNLRSLQLMAMNAFLEMSKFK